MNLLTSKLGKLTPMKGAAPRLSSSCHLHDKFEKKGWKNSSNNNIKGSNFRNNAPCYLSNNLKSMRHPQKKNGTPIRLNKPPGLFFAKELDVSSILKQCRICGTLGFFQRQLKLIRFTSSKRHEFPKKHSLQAAGFQVVKFSTPISWDIWICFWGCLLVCL